MAIQGVDTKCYILALFVRDDGERFLLGSGHYEFKNTQMHFAANAIQNDIVEVQGNDGFLLAGQVRRPGTQSFDGYVGDGTMSKEETESYRRQFFSFFRKNFFYKVIYVFSDGTAIQRKSGFLVDDPTVEELYQMYPEYHVALNFEDVNYYSYSEDEEGQEQYAKEATIDTSSMRATGGLIWDNLGVVWEATQWGGEQTVSGTEITIQNDMSVPSIVDDIRLDGDTEQQTYSGKNLFPLGTGSYTNHGFTSVYNADGSITVSGTADATYADLTANRTVNYEQGKTYTISITEALPIGFGLIALGSGVQREDINIAVGAKSGKRTLSYTHNIAKLYIYNLTVGQSYSFTVYPMLEAGSTATSYEPYVGGIPAPNPDYPQNVQVVTGEQTIWITGKNMLDSSSYTDQYVNSSGNAVPGGGTNALFGYVPVSPSTQYTLSASSSTRMNFAYFDASKTFVSRDTGHDTNSYTITTPDNCQFVRIWVYKFGGIDQAVIDSYRLMFEKGSTVTDYTPFQGEQSYTISLGSIELCKIGDYEDKIFNNDPNEDWYDPDLEDNAWYVHKEFGKYIFNGTETIAYNSSNKGFTINPTNLANYMPNHATPPMVGLSTHFSVNSTTSTWTGDNRIGLSSSGTFWCKATSFATSQSDCLTWLSANKPSVYYALATASDTKITDATLVGQLNALGAMKLFIGENNLAIQATGTNLPAPLSFKYYTTVSVTGAEWEEGGSGGATVVEIDSITNTYPIWRVKGPAVNPQLSVINTNTTIRYTGTVTSTQTLEIDMFNKTAKLNGVSVIGNISGDWVSLAPGTNRVIYTAENADAQPSTIEWQEVVG